jgi:hypothetical protein
MDLRRDGVRDGRAAVYRMRWHDIARDSLRWDWECSTDGETWQTLWAIAYLRSR